MCDTFSIKNVASSVLENLSRTSFSEDGFTREQIDAISDAIAAAIEEYDKQKSSN